VRDVPNKTGSLSGAPHDLLPDAELLERARGLAQRFPEAHLREVTLLRAPIESKARIWLALECMQVTGSFKVRGALLAMEARKARAERDAERAARSGPKSAGVQGRHAPALGTPLEVLAVSAGNHGIGVSLASKALGARATIMVPRGAPRTKTDKIASYGATVLHAQSTGYDEAEIEAMELARTRDVPFLSPYDDLDVLAGNGASLGFEIVRALGRVPDLVYAPIGGGGLAIGLACAMKHEGSSAPRVWGVQSEASCAFAQSLERGAAVTALPPAITLAEGLEGGISERSFARARATLAGAIVVTEEELANAMRFAYRELGLALEGSAAAALAAVLAAPARTDGDLVVVLTGRNVDPERLAQIVC
jgi:threonine dehydratase